jgi:hypothetical protein
MEKECKRRLTIRPHNQIRFDTFSPFDEHSGPFLINPNNRASQAQSNAPLLRSFIQNLLQDGSMDSPEPGSNQQIQHPSSTQQKQTSEPTGSQTP